MSSVNCSVGSTAKDVKIMKFYKHDIPDWMDATESLSDGAYRAYHVICQLIYTHEGPIRMNERGLAGRCNQRVDRFLKNFNELITGGYVTYNDGIIDQYRCHNELISIAYSNDKRSNTLKNKARDKVSPPKEKTREEKTRQDKTIYTSVFESFWNVYPRKIGKRTAFKSWLAANKRGNGAVIYNGAKRLAEQVDAGKDLRYVPHPATWLNRDGWLDEEETKQLSTIEKAALNVFKSQGGNDECNTTYEWLSDDSELAASDDRSLDEPVGLSLSADGLRDR